MQKVLKKRMALQDLGRRIIADYSARRCARKKFIFTVRDDAVAQQLLANAGNRVVLTYAQHKGVPTSCLGETEYFIEKVQVVQ
ncbi:hypothetical protein ACFS07_17135 [Undibacterium arcticum]